MSEVVLPRIYIRDTGTPRGRGVFAGQVIHAGALIETSPVVVIDTPFAQLPFVLQHMVFAWPASDGAHDVHGLALGYGSLFNGANPANVRFERDGVRSIIRFFAARDIVRDEELTINYSAGDGGVVSNDDAWFVEHGIRTSVEPAR